MKHLILLAVVIVLLAACKETSADSSNELLISSASSLADAMESVEKEFQKTHPEVKLVFNSGSSSKLRNQIQQGAPVDLFLSASVKDMDLLVRDGLVQAEAVQNFAKNRLVLASAMKLQETDPEKLLGNSGRLIAVGEPESVPLGFYTKKVLGQMELWDGLEGDLIFAKDARQVLSYIESGNAEMGVVYSSDALLSSSIETVLDLPQEGIDIVYPAGILQEAENKKAAEAFLAFLTSEKGQELLEDYGFAPVEGAQR